MRTSMKTTLIYINRAIDGEASTLSWARRRWIMAARTSMGGGMVVALALVAGFGASSRGYA